MKRNQIIAIGLIVVLILWTFGGTILKSCKGTESTKDANGETPTTVQLQKAPVFSQDTAYNYIAKQVSFGPRIPGTTQHKTCGDWIQNQLKKYGATVTTQSFVGVAYDGVKRNSTNIIGAINPAATKRILIAAHWDTRPIADQDDENKEKPILGAIDGGSGVAVALEIARLINANPLNQNLGVDFIFFDNEDNGTPDGITPVQSNTKYGFWCLGSEYWAANKHIPNYSAYFGILLDMVGGKGTYFNQEGYSKQYANSIVEQVWGVANQLGYSQYFKNEVGSQITDDHVPVNEIAKIPMIDIISTDGQNFGNFWHTHDDNLNSVSKEHLKAVGQTVLQVIYNEQ
jgi:glutaminyl-peptide cyclotransferase